MKLPRIWLPEAERFGNWTIDTPLPAFPEMTLRSAVEAPPMVLLLAFWIRMPSPLPTPAVPAALVPMKLPRIWLPEAGMFADWRMSTPLATFPEMTLRPAAEASPMVLSLAFSIPMPSPLPSPAVPAALVPIRLPSTMLLTAWVPPGLKISMPAWALPEMTLPGPVPGEAVAPPIVLPDEPYSRTP